MVKIPAVRILRWTVPWWGIGLAFVVLGVAAYAPYLGSGFAADDFIFINMLEGAISLNPLAGFWFGEMDTYPGFTLLWWADPGLSGAFLRPLPSWTITLLYWLFGRNAVPFHLTLILVHALGAFTAFLVLRRLSGRDGPALLAALLFLICEDHGMTVAWIATLTDLLCVLFLNLAFLCHLSARQADKPRPWLFGLSLGLFLAAIASKETAAIYPGIVIIYEFFFADRLDNIQDRVSLTARLRLFFRHGWAWAIPLAVLVAYLLFYRSLIPPMRNLMYQDPFGQPAAYLGTMLVNLPVMVAGLLTQFMPSLAVFLPQTLPFVAVGGAVLIMLLVWALWPYRGERAVWFSLLVFVLGLLPGLATEPGERLLYFPSIYGLFVVAWLIIQLPFLRRRITPDAPPGVPVLGAVWGWYLLFSALILPLILLFIYPSMWIPGLQLPEQAMLDSLPLIEEDRHAHVVYLNTGSSYNTFYLPDIYRYHRGQYIDLRLLSSFNGRVWARQESERGLELKTEDTGWLDNMFARIVRVEPEFTTGQLYSTPLFTATVLAVTPDKQDVRAVRFEFDRPLTDPSLVFLYYDGQTYRRWSPTPSWEQLNSELEPFGF